jgi:hypothetical protein
MPIAPLLAHVPKPCGCVGRMNKKALSERDICSKFITPTLVSAKWDLKSQIAEQKRFVAKVEELMRWCDQLEAHLATARTTGAHLLDATLSEGLLN